MQNKKNASIVRRSRICRAAIETLESRQLLSGSTPFFTNPFGTNQLIPAADYDKGGEGVAYHDTTPTNLGNDTFRSPDAVDMSTGGATGHVVNNTATGEWLIYTLTVPVAGTYNLVAGVSNTATGAQFHPDFNGVYTTGPIAVPNTGSFSNYVGVETIVPATLAAGTIRMRIYIDTVGTNGAGGNFEGFNLVPTTLPGPTAEAPYTKAYTVGQTIPAAQYDRGGESVGYHDTNAQNNGNDDLRQPGGVDISYGGSTGDIVGFTAPGEWLNYSLNVATAGKYVLQTSVANPSTGAAFHASENGLNLSGSIAVPATASFTTYAIATSAPFTLASGSQVLQIDFDKNAANGAVGNFDTFKLVPFVSAADVPFTAAFATNAVVPAANYDKGGEGIAYHDTTPTNLGNSTFRAGDGVDISTGGTTGNVVGFTAVGEYLNYTLNVAAAGMYILEASVANPVGGATFHGSVAGANLTGAITVAATAGFTTYGLDKSAAFSLAAGKQVLQINLDKAASNGAIGNFDYFKLIPFTAPADTPFTTAFATNTLIPAANFDNGGEGVSYHDTTPTNQGPDNYRPGTGVDIEPGGTTKNLVAYTAAGEWLQYTINVATAGTYELQASVAQPAAGASFHMQINGTNLTGAIAIPPSAGFQSFETVTSSSFTLAKGTQIIRIFLDKAATNGAVANFDWFKIVPA